MSVVLGLDTSCYTTSCAAVSLDGRVMGSCRRLLPVRQGERGLRQSEAVFAHVRQMPEVLEELGSVLQGERIEAVCASSRPRDDGDSYMPVFQVGEGQARAIAAMLGIPCFFSTHQRGHLWAARVDSGMPEGDCLFVHLSGGTTEMLSLRDHALTLIGGTRDLHAGQLVDRIGVELGLPFPAGPYLEKLAGECVPLAAIPVSMEEQDCFCHLSGAESKARQLLKQGMPQDQVAAEVYDVLARCVARMLIAGKRKTGLQQALVAGGVASSALFRKRLRERLARKDDLKVYFGRPEYSGDNAVGAALIGREKYLGDDRHVGSSS